MPNGGLWALDCYAGGLEYWRPRRRPGIRCRSVCRRAWRCGRIGLGGRWVRSNMVLSMRLASLRRSQTSQCGRRARIGSHVDFESKQVAIKAKRGGHIVDGEQGAKACMSICMGTEVNDSYWLGFWLYFSSMAEPISALAGQWPRVARMSLVTIQGSGPAGQRGRFRETGVRFSVGMRKRRLRPHREQHADGEDAGWIDGSADMSASSRG